MFPFSKTNKILGNTLLCCLLVTPILAHEVRVDGNVAITFHLEPNHSPKVGQEARVWFALTLKGGTPIPLDMCDCQLVVERLPKPKGTSQPLMKPLLRAIDVEKYQGIPASTLVFPKPGIYQLELSGKPKKTGKFLPFKSIYQVTVTN
jgi:hypothetical protein